MNFSANSSSLTSVKVHNGNGALFPAVSRQLPIISRPVSFMSFRNPPNKSLFFSFAPIKAAAFNSSTPQEPLTSSVPSSKSVLPFVKTSFIATAVAAAALFFSRTHFFSCKPAIASPAISSTSSSETAALSDEEKEKSLEKFLLSDPNNVEALQSLLEIRVRTGKTEDSFRIVDKLIELEPEETEWPLMKAHIHVYAGEVEKATRGFVELIVKHPLKVEAYHGLIVAVSQDFSQDEDSKEGAMKEILKMIDKAIKTCEEEKKDTVLRDFKLMKAQIYVVEGRYTDALVIYQQLAQDDPKDFRPYLCQGIIFTVLKKKKEAEKYFEKYRSLVPNEHPNARYFEDSMIATKAFAQEMENSLKT